MTAENQRDEHQSIHIHGSADNSVIILGNDNKVQHINISSHINAGQTSSATSLLLSKQMHRWRQVLVNKVKHDWIDGVLENSLHNQALIKLGLEERRQAVTSSLSGTAEFAEEAAQPFPKSTKA